MTSRRFVNRALGLSAIGLQVIALGAAVQWFRHTDWLFAHYQGPAGLVVTARLCAAFGIGVSVLWLILSLRSAHVSTAIGFVLLLLAFPAILLLWGWAADATWKSRNWWDEPRNYQKPLDTGAARPTPERP